MSAKRTVVVMYGGQSTEHEISCRSAAFILKNIDRNKYDVHAVAIDKEGHWWPQDLAKTLAGDPQIVPILRDETLAREHPVVKALLPAIGNASLRRDLIVFPILHGTNGEDGAIQGLFDLTGVAYVGPDTMGSALSMNKVAAKQLVEAAGVPVVPYAFCRKEEWQQQQQWQKIVDDIQKRLPFPLFVKPASLGSSVGISKVKEVKDLAAAIDNAFKVDELVLVEQGMNVREIEYAALGGYTPDITAAGEIVVQAADFYSYEEKYSTASKAEVKVPADLPAAKATEGSDLAQRIFKALYLHGMARIDLFLTKDTQKFYFNEANTIPGFTSISQYPQLWKHSGLNAAMLLDRLLTAAWNRREMRQGLQRTK